MRSFAYLLGLIVVILAFVVVEFYNENKQLERTVYAAQSRDFSTATQKLALLHSTIEQSLLFQDEKTLAKELDTIWRTSSELRQSVANMSLQQGVQQDWMRYLGKIGDRAKQVAQTGDYAQWQQHMRTVATNLQSFAEEWRVATVAFYNNDGDMNKWTNNHQLELDESPFVNVSKQLKSYNETDFPLTASESDYEKKRDLQYVTDAKITKQQALDTFKNYFPHIDDAIVTVSKSKDDAPYPFYHIQFVRGARIGYADITENGGHLLSFLLERPVTNQPRSHEEITLAATNFMTSVGYNDVTITETRENHEAWHFVFTRTLADGALVYPDSIQVKVAKDNGEIVGVNAMEYIQKEQIKAQTEMPIDWQQFFSNNVTVEDMKKVYTTNETFELRKCYEVLVRVDNAQHDTYRIVIDTQTQNVLKIEKLY